MKNIERSLRILLAGLSVSAGVMACRLSTNPNPVENTPEATTSLCNGKCWEIDQNNRRITWVGPVDGREDIFTADEFESLVESGYSAKIPETTVAWRVEICNTGETRIINDQKVVILPEAGKCTTDLQVGEGSILVEKNSSGSGGFRLSPQK